MSIKALIVVESCFGNTLKLAEAIATALNEKGTEVTLVDTAQIQALSEVPGLENFKLIILGAPTHNRQLSTAKSREIAANKGGRPFQIGINEVAQSLSALPGARLACFDTVVNKGFLAGSAAKALKNALAKKKFTVIACESFLVKEDALVEDAEALAKAWARTLLE